MSNLCKRKLEKRELYSVKKQKTLNFIIPIENYPSYNTFIDHIDRTPEYYGFGLSPISWLESDLVPILWNKSETSNVSYKQKLEKNYNFKLLRLMETYL